MRQVEFHRLLDESNALRVSFRIDHGRVLEFVDSNGMKSTSHLVDRNLQMTQKVMSYLMINPYLFESLPDKFELVLLPDDDPELRAYNLDLLDRFGSEACAVVFARLSVAQTEVTPQVFVPVLKAA
jgi:hypothetical protein